jgi:hypothetical protein
MGQTRLVTATIARRATGAQHRAIIGLVAKNKPSVDFCEYWQRNATA